MIRSVLITNRGEIAIRVMRTCRKLGIRTIAIYSDADRDALHVRHADEAYRVGPPPALESYLNQPAILEIANKSGAEAVHPGYGFLSESADFADAVLADGLIWIGPPPSAMRMLGEKAPAKALAEQLNVPVLPGYHGDDQSANHLAHRAQEMGFPLLIKASAGGGGRGMRLVESAAEFTDALDSAKREAQSSFGNQHVLLEKYVLRPRHVEVQILGDTHGNVVHLGERECSIQRRHQKLVEESPSPVVDADLRERMGAAAIALARAAGYEGAGTVEFILDDSGSFYFLELNARLQVEHPVTEMVTGLDLVELQLQVADGQPLPVRQTDIEINGHAIETRIIAEDPLSGFLPSTGEITGWSLPEAIKGSIRIDAGFDVGSMITPYYDSLLAKMIVWARDRTDAVALLRQALAECSISGPRTNLDVLLTIAEHPAFQAGDLHTGFLEEHEIVEGLLEQPPEVLAAVTAISAAAPSSLEGSNDVWQDRSTWRQAGTPRLLLWQRAGEITSCVTLRHPGSATWDIESSGNLIQAQTLDVRTVSIDGNVAKVTRKADGRLLVYWKNRSYHVTPARPPDAIRADSSIAVNDGTVTAPMPGRVVKLQVTVGDSVTERQPLLVLESMKIEHVVTAPGTGKLAKLNVSEGAQVQAGAVLAEIKPEN